MQCQLVKVPSRITPTAMRPFWEVHKVTAPQHRPRVVWLRRTWPSTMLDWSPTPHVNGGQRSHSNQERALRLERELTNKHCAKYIVSAEIAHVSWVLGWWVIHNFLGIHAEEILAGTVQLCESWPTQFSHLFHCKNDVRIHYSQQPMTNTEKPSFKHSW